MTAVAPTSNPGPRQVGSRRARAWLRPGFGLAEPPGKDVRYGVASGVVHETLFIAGATIAAYVVGRAVRGATYDSLSLYLLGLVIIVLPQVRTPWLEATAFEAIANRIQVQVRVRVFDSLTALTPAGLSGRRSGELGHTAMADVETIQQLYAQTLPMLLVAAVVPAAAVLALAVLSWQLALVAIPFLVTAAVLPVWLNGEARRPATARRDPRAELSAELVDALQGLREVVTFGAQDAVVTDLIKRSERGGRLHITQSRRLAAQTLAAELLASAGPLIALALAAALVARHHLSATLLPPAVTLATLAFGPIGRLAEATRNWGGAGAAAQRVTTLLETPAPVHDTTRDHMEAPATCSVEFRDVVFRYRPDQPTTLNDVSFTVAPGETVALAGHSGAGKSTCTNLLLRFWDPQHGSITVGGVDIRDLSLAQLHQLVGLVTQDVYLFNTTVRENLRLGRPDASDSQLENAARAAQAWEFIAALPDGLDTLTGERGVQLSAGERQRLAIARVLLADPPILVLDEPTSNLDTDTEHAVTQAMASLRAGRTTIIVAHRLSTIRTADRIIVLDHGHVADIATHAELVARQGSYLPALLDDRRSTPDTTDHTATRLPQPST